jgi:hypothetical protein
MIKHACCDGSAGFFHRNTALPKFTLTIYYQGFPLVDLIFAIQ